MDVISARVDLDSPMRSTSASKTVLKQRSTRVDLLGESRSTPSQLLLQKSSWVDLNWLGIDLLVDPIDRLNQFLYFFFLPFFETDFFSLLKFLYPTNM